MSRLLLLRHAKSSWDDPSLADIDRPLSRRGEKAAAAMAEVIVAKRRLPDRILCSSALRTRQMLAFLLPVLSGERQVVLTPRLYEPAAGDYSTMISDLGSDAETLMVIGHNPTIQATALALIGGGDRQVTEAVAGKFPTGALAVLRFEGSDWSRLERHTGVAEEFVVPRGSD